MVDKIHALKDRILQHTEHEAQDMKHLDVKEVGELVDMVKDLAEAEACCEKATYYRTVVKAMGGEDTEKYNEVLNPIRDVMKKVGPAEREKMMHELRSMLE